MPRAITEQESKQIGFAIGDPLLAIGHPLTCNGGNMNFNTHHPDMILMVIEDEGKPEPYLICPDCGREQELPPGALDGNR